MKDKKRKHASRVRAERYAPQPQSSWLMYGVVGVVLGSLAIWALGRFYSVSPLEYSAWIVVALLAVFAGSIALRTVRSRRHAIAHRREYDKTRKDRHLR
jgi:ABC-type Fe3+ transport system permease subunit